LSFSWNDNTPQFLREELFELVDEWCEQLFGTSEKPEAAAYELARLAANHAAIEALYSIRIRMGDHTYRYQEDDGSLTYEQAEQLAFDGLAALEQRERQVEREACCKYLNDEAWEGLGDKLRAHRAVSDVVSPTPRPQFNLAIETGSVWRSRSNPEAGNYVVIYGGYRVIGRNPQGHAFRSSVGSFLRAFEKVSTESVFYGIEGSAIPAIQIQQVNHDQNQ
jgi:hypothetical protein